MKRLHLSKGTHFDMKVEEDGRIRGLLTTNVDEHLKKAKLDRDRSPHKRTFASQDYQVLGTIPPVIITQLMDKGIDLLSGGQDAMNAAMRWLDENPMFKSTNKHCGQLPAQGAI